jgi:DNA-binding NarL/FixJ family response regulator
MTKRQIAAELLVSESTVEVCLRRISEKLADKPAARMRKR